MKWRTATRKETLCSVQSIPLSPFSLSPVSFFSPSFSLYLCIFLSCFPIYTVLLYFVIRSCHYEPGICSLRLYDYYGIEKKKNLLLELFLLLYFLPFPYPPWKLNVISLFFSAPPSYESCVSSGGQWSTFDDDSDNEEVGFAPHYITYRRNWTNFHTLGKCEHHWLLI